MFTVRHVRTAAFALLTSTAVLGGCSSQLDRSPAPLTPRALAGSQLVAENGVAVNGVAINGVAINGVAINGVAVNGVAINGVAINGVAVNGMSTNGLAPGAGSNALATNGLTQAALTAPEFGAWFAADPVYASMVMSYLARCALGPDQTLTYETADASYAWTGNLAVAPVWATGTAIPDGEQQLVSACLAGHVNGLGQHVTISVRGYHASGEIIAMSEGEAAQFPHREACFFGNLFDATGVWNALEPDLLDPTISTPRGCSAEFGEPQDCPPMVKAGMCADVCTVGADGVTWADCVVNGVHYRPVAVFLQDSDVYRCGDGVCQSVTENETTCAADCPAPAPDALDPTADPTAADPTTDPTADPTTTPTTDPTTTPTTDPTTDPTADPTTTPTTDPTTTPTTDPTTTPTTDPTTTPTTDPTTTPTTDPTTTPTTDPTTTPTTDPTTTPTTDPTTTPTDPPPTDPTTPTDPPPTDPTANPDPTVQP
jgi:hypothetical protein